MATGIVDLINQALTELGEPPISSPDEKNRRAITATANLARSRDEVLYEHGWRCATKRTTLSVDGNAPAFEYSNAFVLPSDFIAVVEFNGIKGEAQVPTPWKIEGQRILTNDSTGELVYVFRQEDISQLDPGLQGCIAANLAAKIAVSVTGDQAKKTAMEAIYRDRLSTAMMRDREGAGVELQQPGFWLAARETPGRLDERPIDVGTP